MKAASPQRCYIRGLLPGKWLLQNNETLKKHTNDPSWPFRTNFLKRVNEYTSGIKHIYHPLSATKRSTCSLLYSQSHYIISLKEAKRYFNKTRCSMTFDPFTVDPVLLTPLTPASDSGGQRSCKLCGEWRQRGRDSFTERCTVREDSVFSVKRWQPGSICQSIILSVILPFYPSRNVKKRNRAITTSDHFVLNMSAHYIILSSLQAALTRTITVVDSPQVFGELRGSECQ